MSSEFNLSAIAARVRRRDLFRRCFTTTAIIILLVVLTHFALKHTRLPPVPNNGTNGTIRMSRYWRKNISGLAARIPPTDFSGVYGKTGSEFSQSSLKVHFDCPGTSLKRHGADKEGGKWTCGLERLGLLTSFKNYKCKVYTFGVSNDTQFEEKILLQTGCTLFVHDPKIESWESSLRTNPRVVFRKIGIDGDNGYSINGYMSWVGGSRLSSLRSIMGDMAHRWIDILKIDVEGAEFESLERILQDFMELPIGQLLVEMHVSWLSPDWDSLIALFQRLEAKGMRLFHVEPSKKDVDYTASFSLINLHALELFVDGIFYN